MIDLEAINMAKTSIEIRWKAPDGDYSEFLVKVTDMQGAAVSSQQVASSVLRQELGSLSTGTKYNITMYTVSSDQQSDGSTISATTREAPLPLSTPSRPPHVRPHSLSTPSRPPHVRPHFLSLHHLGHHT